MRFYIFYLIYFRSVSRNLRRGAAQSGGKILSNAKGWSYTGSDAGHAPRGVRTGSKVVQTSRKSTLAATPATRRFSPPAPPC